MRGITAVALCLLVWAAAVESLCDENPGWTTPDIPHPGSHCFKEDLEIDEETGDVTEKRRPVEGIQSCDQFVRCHQSMCQWQVETCPGDPDTGTIQFFDQEFNDCVEPMQADCAASLFGPDPKRVIIENPERNGRVIFDCQGCLNNNNGFPADSPAVGYETDPDFDWQWKLIAAKRDAKILYSFAFDKDPGDGSFKMLTDLGKGKGGTQVFSTREGARGSNTQFRIVPNADVDKRDQFRISNRDPNTREVKYLVMSDEPLKVFFGEREVKKLLMRKLDLGDNAQLWRFNFPDR